MTKRARLGNHDVHRSAPPEIGTKLICGLKGALGEVELGGWVEPGAVREQEVDRSIELTDGGGLEEMAGHVGGVSGVIGRIALLDCARDPLVKASPAQRAEFVKQRLPDERVRERVPVHRVRLLPNQLCRDSLIERIQHLIAAGARGPSDDFRVEGAPGYSRQRENLVRQAAEVRKATPDDLSHTLRQAELIDSADERPSPSVEAQRACFDQVSEDLIHEVRVAFRLAMQSARQPSAVVVELTACLYSKQVLHISRLETSQ